MLARGLNAAGRSVSTDISGIELMALGARFAGFDMSHDLTSGLEPTEGVYEGGVWYEKVKDRARGQTMMTARRTPGLPPYADESEPDRRARGMAPGRAPPGALLAKAGREPLRNRDLWAFARPEVVA